MKRTTKPPSFDSISDAIAARLRRSGVKLTIGGEPSYLPVEPVGAEWNVTALGPAKLGYAHALADALIKRAVPCALAILSPGKTYPGEPDPRWAIHLLSNRDGTPIAPGLKGALRKGKPNDRLAPLRRSISKELGVPGGWLRARDTLQPASQVWVLPLDYDGARWVTGEWPSDESGELPLIEGQAPAGLRLPLSSLPASALRRALVLEYREESLHVFLPPLLQRPFIELVRTVFTGLHGSGMGTYSFGGYVPHDEAAIWSKISVTPDPGVLEINLPPCETVARYAWWLDQLETCGAEVGLRSFKQPTPDETIGTGGGNHLLFGGPTLDENPFFTRPQWVTSILRYWQRHPSLAYVFTGIYVGVSSQAPRPDETARELYDLEMAYQFLEKLEPGVDHRYLISETLRHLHIDRSGNTHRSETSFDKFWNAGWDGGCRGLIEFRAVEALPHAAWMSHVALLWCALAASLLEKPCLSPLVEHGAKLNDLYFLPTPLWEDLAVVLAEAKEAGFPMDEPIFRSIWEYRFPKMLSADLDGAELEVRKALEGWPLLCETPVEGGNTSRFVDTSIERLEFAGNEAFAAGNRVFVQSRELKLGRLPGAHCGAGLRYRRTALYPSLHPGITPHVPLFVTITDRKKRALAHYRLDQHRRQFEPVEGEAVPNAGAPCKKLRPDLLTCDLRLG